ncbi:helix-turn-helix transcriptional regulator [Natrinema salinisoli]|uniref:helix-turn-helix transcriptional regulator n=1 Tax=Natrinema salinisoli TaxID=2878535 RepID=UPI001CF0D3BE|nr:DUF4897 domain-containing protein [Natrinema salinisoli]
MSTAFDRTAVILAVILTLGAVPLGTTASTGQSEPTGIDEGAAITAAETPAADTTVTRIALDENGTAHWSVTVRTRLANDSEVDDYEAFQEQFRADRETYVEQFERRMTGVVSNAAESTDRNMTASSFRAETSIQEVPRQWGRVTYSFTWTNFGAVDGDEVAVGDVFEGGFYLDDDDRLQIAPPNGYTPTATAPPPDERDGTTVVWAGPESFADHRPTVRFEPADSAVDSDREGTNSWGRMPLVVGGSILLVAIAAIAVSVTSQRGFRRRLRSSLPVLTDGATDPAATGTDDGLGAERDGDESAGTPASSPASPASDLATDEDRVRTLLERNDGRMRQAAIADELDWSASKTSRVLSGMAEDDAVEKLRIGRENVIDLLENAD